MLMANPPCETSIDQSGPASPPEQTANHVTEHRALGRLAVVALIAILWLARPFASALLLGILMAFTLDPLYTFLARRTDKPFSNHV